MSELDKFTIAFLTCALWTIDETASSGEWSEHAPYTIANIDAETLTRLADQCADFQRKYGHLIEGCTRGAANWTDEERAGHDFLLTRNGHGAGFWDGDWPEPNAGILTTASKSYGEVYMYLGDDGRIYA